MCSRPLCPEELPADCGVPEGVKAAQREFWMCGSCGKVFWQGGQYGIAMSRLSGRLSQLMSPPLKGGAQTPLRRALQL